MLLLLPPLLFLVLIVLLLLDFACFVIIVIDESLEVVLFLAADVFKRESIAQCHSQVGLLVYADEETREREEFFVILIFLKRRDGHSITKLLAETVHGVVDEDDVLHFNVLDDAQILQIDVILRFNATVSVESVLKQLAGLVYVVEYLIRVPLVTGRENCNFIIFVHFP